MVAYWLRTPPLVDNGCAALMKEGTQRRKIFTPKAEEQASGRAPKDKRRVDDLSSLLHLFPAVRKRNQGWQPMPPSPSRPYAGCSLFFVVRLPTHELKGSQKVH
jgi:hypothetical protein